MDFSWLWEWFFSLFKNFLKRTNSTKEIIYDKVYVGHFDILSTYSLLFAIKKLKDINFKSLIKENKRLILKLKNELVQMS